MRLRLIAFLLLLLPALASAQTVRGDVGAALDAYLTEQVSPDFSGVVLAARDGEIVLRKGYGYADREAGTPNTPETIFQIGSVTKPLTAVAVMTLVDQGLLDPSDSIAEYLDGVPEDKCDITIHHLLTHAAGYPNALGPDYDAVGRDAYVRLAMAYDLPREPGVRYEYSNVGYALLAAIIETVTGGSYDAYLQRVLGDAGIHHTGYRLAEGTVAHGYDGDADLGLPFDRPWAEDGPYWHLRGNGGLLSTADDLYALHLALEGGEILSPASFRAMHTPHIEEGPGAGSHYGYGWALFTTPRGTSLVGHNGGDPGFTSDVLRFREENAVLIVLSNDLEVNASRLARPLEQILFGGTAEPMRRAANEPLALDRLPELEMGRRALAFVETVNAATADASRAFARAHLDDEFNRNVDRLVGFFEAVRDEMGGAPFDLERAEWDPNQGAIHLFTTLPDGRGYRAELAFQPDGEHRVAGLFTDYVAGAPEVSDGLGFDLPDTPAGHTVERLLHAIQGDADTIRAFIQTGLSPALRDAYPEAEHLALLRQLQGDVFGGEVQTVDARGADTVVLGVRQMGGFGIQLTFQVEPEAPHRIIGISADER